MSETDIKKRQSDLDKREQDLSLLERNLCTTREMLRMEHLSQTQTIEKVSRKVAADLKCDSGLCPQGERITRIEGKQDTTLEIVHEIREAQKIINDKIEKLFEGRNNNKLEIATIKNTGKVFIGVLVFFTPIIGGLFVWLFKDYSALAKALEAITKP